MKFDYFFLSIIKMAHIDKLIIKLKTNCTILHGNTLIPFHLDIFPEKTEYWKAAFKFNESQNMQIFECPKDWDYSALLKILRHYCYLVDLKEPNYQPDLYDFLDVWKIAHEIQDDYMLYAVRKYVQEDIKSPSKDGDCYKEWFKNRSASSVILPDNLYIISGLIKDLFSGEVFKDKKTDLFAIRPRNYPGGDISRSCDLDYPYAKIVTVKSLELDKCRNHLLTIYYQNIYHNRQLIEKLFDYYDTYSLPIPLTIGLLVYHTNIKPPKNFTISDLKTIIDWNF